MKRLRTMPLKYILIFFIGGSTFLMLLLLSGGIYHFSKATIENNYQENYASYMELYSSAVEVQLDDIIEEERDLLEDTRFMNILKTGGISDSHYFSSNEQIYIDSTFNSIENDNEFVRGLLVVNKDGHFRYVRKSGLSNAVTSYYKIGNILEMDWVEIADEGLGKEIVLGWNVLDVDDTANVSIIKQMNDPGSGECVGYVVATVSKKIIRHVLGMHTNVLESCAYMIIETRVEPDDDNYIVYSNNIDEESYDEILEAYNQGDESKYIFGSYEASNSSWQILSVVTKEKLTEQSAYIREMSFATAFVILLISIPAFIFFVSIIDRPLENLEEAIKELGHGNYKPDIVFDDSEIGRVGQYLLDTAENNIDLREKLLSSELNEREAQLMLLQSQINPHFLYNTLDALYFMAVIDKADDVAEMVKSMSDIFKLSLNNGEDLISIRDQLKLAESYMDVMNKRYQERFSLEIDVAEEILDKRILSFLLQPVIENAVTHGLEKKIGPGRVTIVGFIDEDEIKLTVNDNGVGVADLSRLNEGYGIRNIQERIELYYGKEYLAVFESQVGAGTTVFFRFPLNKREGNI